jgi:hypothetical protein
MADLFGTGSMLLDNSAFLPKEQELLFQRDMMFAPGWSDWRRGFERDYGQYPNTDPGGDYNYRAAWALGAVPEINQHDGRYHGFSQAEMPPYAQPVPLKQGGPPTEWKQKFMEKFGADPDGVELYSPEMLAFLRDLIDSQMPLVLGSPNG